MTNPMATFPRDAMAQEPGFKAVLEAGLARGFSLPVLLRHIHPDDGDEPAFDDDKLVLTTETFGGEQTWDVALIQLAGSVDATQQAMDEAGAPRILVWRTPTFGVADAPHQCEWQWRT